MIRPAHTSDIAIITSIYNEAIAEGGFTGDTVPVSPESRETWFDEHRGCYAVFVMEDAGFVAGYVALSPYRKGRQAFSATCEISYYVAREHRRRGIGKKLVSHAIEYAGRSDFRVIVAVLLESNQPSVMLLESFNFSECGRVPAAACIDGSFVDHLYMSRQLECVMRSNS